MDIEMVRKEIKKKKKPKNEPHRLKKYINKCLLVVLGTILTLIFLKGNPTYQEVFYKEVFSTHFSFASFHKWYEDTFGSPIPFKELLKDPVASVFEEELAFSNAEPYLDGVSLQVSKNYLVPSLESGMVIFVGEKEGFGKVVILEGTSGVETWYGNLENIPVKVYDYLEKGSLIGEANEKLYLVFMKEGEYLSYENYLSV